MVKRRLFSFLFWLVKCYFGTGFSYVSLWIRGEWYDFFLTNHWASECGQLKSDVHFRHTWNWICVAVVSISCRKCMMRVPKRNGGGFFNLIFLLYTLLVELFSGRGSSPLNSKWKEEARNGHERKTAGSSWDAGQYILFTDLQIDRWFSITTLN